MTLASLTNLETLALKGGPSLTDKALTPLAAMPQASRPADLQQPDYGAGRRRFGRSPSFDRDPLRRANR